jgi:hypothetical protein
MGSVAPAPMFQALLELRLLIIDSLNNLAANEQTPTAQAWIDILELEAGRLSDGGHDWAAMLADVRRECCDAADPTCARRLGQLESRLALIVADQVVARLSAASSRRRCLD